ncbi:MAG: hypothetical protein ACI9YE_001388 [Psychroserpens sp.]|jgi:hypothetical protein
MKVFYMIIIKEKSHMELTTENGIFDSIIAAMIYQLILSIVNSLIDKFGNNSKSNNIFFKNFYWLITLTATSFIILGVFFFNGWISQFLYHSTVLYILAVNFFIMARRLVKFVSCGVVGADTEIGKGINYKKALNLTKGSLKFLGTGGHKLTVNENEFKKAVHSATDERPACFLLCDPASKALTLMAKKAAVDEQKYVNNVKESLRTLKKLIGDGHSIEVRLYNAQTIAEMPTFRLMFFNNHYCMCSYNIFGNQDVGGKTPQLHLYKKHDTSGDTSFYTAFSRYFDGLWVQNEDKKVDLSSMS